VSLTLTLPVPVCTPPPPSHPPPQEPTPRHVAVKEVVLPFNKFPGADTLLGPEMRSTGEVMGIDYDFASSYAKAQIAAGAGPGLSWFAACNPSMPLHSSVYAQQCVLCLVMKYALGFWKVSRSAPPC
jgi:hypothetical protein